MQLYHATAKNDNKAQRWEREKIVEHWREVSIESFLIEPDEVLFLMKWDNGTNVFNGLSSVLNKHERCWSVCASDKRTFPPSSESDVPAFFWPAWEICWPCIMPVKTISGAKHRMTSVNFQPAVKLITKAAIKAPKAVRIAPSVGPVKPFSEAASDDSRVTSAPRLFSSRSNQPISCRSIVLKDMIRIRMVNSSPALAKASEETNWQIAPPTPIKNIE